MILQNRFRDPWEEFGERPDPVSKIVKYFSPRRAKDILNGRLWVSTLVEFRRGEGLRFSDQDEGTATFIVDLQGDFKIGVQLPGMDIAPGPVGAFRDNLVSWPANAYATCFSWGPYDYNHHQTMIKNENHDLTCYAEFDAPRLLSAVSHVVERSGIIGTGQLEFRAGKVRYIDRQFHLSLRAPQHDGFRTQDFANYALTRTTFCKPLLFEYENEFRISFHNAIMGGRSGFLLDSEHIKRSILRHGRIRTS